MELYFAISTNPSPRTYHKKILPGVCKALCCGKCCPQKQEQPYQLQKQVQKSPVGFCFCGGSISRDRKGVLFRRVKGLEGGRWYGNLLKQGTETLLSL